MGKKKIVEENVVDEIVNEEATDSKTMEVTESKPESPKSVRMGTVVRCASLNIREKPSINSSPLCVVLSSTNLVIDTSYKNKEWYKVCTENGIEGFCIKEYVD